MQARVGVKLSLLLRRMQSLIVQWTLLWTLPKAPAATPEVAECALCEFDTIHRFNVPLADVVIASATAISSVGFSGCAGGGLPSATHDSLLAQSFDPKASGAIAVDGGSRLIVHAQLVEDDVVAIPVWITTSDPEGDSFGESRVETVPFPFELKSPVSHLATECVCFSVHIPLVLLAQSVMVAGIFFLHMLCS